MAASHAQAPVETTMTARATLALEIVGYSLHKGLSARQYIGSYPISVGGHQWCIIYYPDGIPRPRADDIKQDDDNGRVSVSLTLVNNGAAEVRALFDLRLINRHSGLSFSLCSSLESPWVFTFLDASVTNKSATVGIMKAELEQSALLHDDCLVIECDLTVIKEPQTVEVEIPPSNLSDNLAVLLNTGEGADVTFKVGGELFPAHKIVLAMRSPVLKAELYGPMIGDRQQGHHITVLDMQPAVFKALLHFIYTDSLPSMEHLDLDDDDDDDDDDEIKEMIKHLLVAADRYALERLKSICEGILCKTLDAQSVATVLALADQHQCTTLKDACVEFAISANTVLGHEVASQDYLQLIRSCRALLVDISERVTKSRKI